MILLADVGAVMTPAVTSSPHREASMYLYIFAVSKAVIRARSKLIYKFKNVHFIFLPFRILKGLMGSNVVLM